MDSEPITVVEVMPDYSAFPLWDRTPGGFGGMLDPDEFSLSAALASRMVAWSTFWELHHVYGTHDESSGGIWDDWAAEGRAICSNLEAELGPAVRVQFWPDR